MNTLDILVTATTATAIIGSIVIAIAAYAQSISEQRREIEARNRPVDESQVVDDVSEAPDFSSPMADAREKE